MSWFVTIGISIACEKGAWAHSRMSCMLAEKQVLHTDKASGTDCWELTFAGLHELVSASL
jgi:hypothetical protein